MSTIETKQPFAPLDLLKNIYKSLSKREEFVKKLPQVHLPSLTRPATKPEEKGKVDEGLIQASDALLETAFVVREAVHAHVSLTPPAPSSLSPQESRLLELETSLSLLYAEKRSQEKAGIELEKKFLKGFQLAPFFFLFALSIFFFFNCLTTLFIERERTEKKSLEETTASLEQQLSELHERLRQTELQQLELQNHLEEQTRTILEASVVSFPPPSPQSAPFFFSSKEKKN